MADNPYVNKVQFGNTTIMDITDTTAVASDVAQGKYFYTANGEKTLGTASGGGGGTHTVYIKSSGDGSYCYITYDNSTYYTAGQSIIVPHGAIITCYVSNVSREVKVNGVIQTVTNNAYNYTVNSDVTALMYFYPNDTSQIWLATNGYVYNQNKTVTTNGTVTAGNNYDGLGTVTVAIPVYDGTVT